MTVKDPTGRPVAAETRADLSIRYTDGQGETQDETIPVVITGGSQVTGDSRCAESDCAVRTSVSVATLKSMFVPRKLPS